MEITFRGKREDNNEWVYGYLLQNDDGTFIVYDSETDLSHNGIDRDLYATYFHKVSEGTVGQYINRDDLNSCDIFMGDIVKFIDNNYKFESVGIVDYANCSFYINKGHSSHYRWSDYDVEVIGNEIDNPMLVDELWEAE